MRKRYGNLFRTLRFKLIFGFFVIVIPVIAFMIYNNLYAIQVVRNQVAQSNKNLISLYMGQIDRNLEEVDKYLYSIASLETGLLVLEMPRDQNPDRYSFERIQLYNKMRGDLPSYQLMDMFFIYSPANEDLMVVANNRIEFGNLQEIQNNLMHVFQDRYPQEVTFKEWFVRKIEGDYNLTRVIKYGNVYIGAWGNAKDLLVPLNLLQLGDNGKAFLATAALEPMADQAFVHANHIDLDYTDADYKLTGTDKKFMVVGEKSARGRFSLIAAIPDSTILEKLPFLRRIVSFISIGALVLLPFILYLLRRNILIPVNRIIMAMRRAEDGNFDIRVAHRPYAFEFNVMVETFNRMISQIQELKINVMEEQLNNQKAELKHLQLQINPHFFLNALNIIYNLAQVKDYALIQEMTHCLVEYFRFMFRSNLTFVALRDEIQHTLNYLRIQEMRFPDKLTFDFASADHLLDGRVPPLVIQTFVENTIKHAVSMDRSVHIHIAVADGGGDMAHIRIRDTGRGFPEEVLARLQKGKMLGSQEGDHIGIWNVQRRLRLLYQDKAQIAFSNDDNQGAIVEVRLPINREAN
ncbi:sensor histidine kinase [Paenibacillus aurantiacus]|uniref:histidine kinase n=1 Tax=Paenibacillus aurantiacus TaxID=1936118 RepID=A0ABV5L071_9BACL